MSGQTIKGIVAGGSKLWNNMISLENENSSLLYGIELTNQYTSWVDFNPNNALEPPPKKKSVAYIRLSQ